MSLRGRPPKPKIFNEQEPGKKAALPSCPKDILDEVGQKKWKETAKVLADMGLLAKADKDALANYCMAYSTLVASLEGIKKGMVLRSDNGGIYQNPYLHVRNRAITQMERLGSLLGLNPVARTRLNAVIVKPGKSGIDSRDRNKPPKGVTG